MVAMATLTQSEIDGVTVVRLEGGLTQDGVGPVAQQFEAATNGPRRVVVDLSGVPVVTTPGLSLLLVGLRRVSAAGGRLVVTGVQGLVADLLRRCRLDAVFALVPDRDEAIRRAAE